jgi:integrase/recombinase XerD
VSDDPLRSFDGYLRGRGLLDHTIRAYVGVVERGGDDVAAYVRRLVRNRAPVGTVVQARAAAAHWLRFRGVSQAEIAAALPPARGRKARTRDALSPDALARFLALADAEREPVRSVLLLLPRTGLRISEVCGLRVGDVRDRDGRTYLDFRGKGDKHRVVPVGEAGAALLSAAVERATRRPSETPDEERPLFTARALRPISPSTVRDAMARLRAGEPLLDGVTPHVLRHTYATRALAGGVDVPRLQALLGHESITTTQRYLHPSVDDLADAVDNIEGL